MCKDIVYRLRKDMVYRLRKDMVYRLCKDIVYIFTKWLLSYLCTARLNWLSSHKKTRFIMQQYKKSAVTKTADFCVFDLYFCRSKKSSKSTTSATVNLKHHCHTACNGGYTERRLSERRICSAASAPPQAVSSAKFPV